MKRPLEANLVSIFRLFVAIEMLALSLVPLVEYLLFRSFTFLEDPFFSLLYQSAILFVYLSIPSIQYSLQRYYLPLGIMLAAVIPSFVNLSSVLRSLAAGEMIDMLRVWAVLPILMVPLVPMAWQYSFKSVVLLFGGLGLLDMLMVVWAVGGVDRSVLDFFYATFIRMTSLLVVGFMISLLIKVLREQRDQLRKANVKLMQQSMMIEEIAVMKERNRIARELHDTLAHTLSGLAVQLEASRTLKADQFGDLQALVATALANVRNGLNETRRALKALRAAPIENSGILAAIYQLAADLNQPGSGRVEIRVTGDMPTMTEELEQHVYRITQEALKNATQHASAQKIWLELSYSEPLLELDIYDNGKGFNLEEQKVVQGYGLPGMQERSELAGGSFSIESEPGSGTHVHFEVEVPSK